MTTILPSLFPATKRIGKWVEKLSVILDNCIHSEKPFPFKIGFLLFITELDYFKKNGTIDNICFNHTYNDFSFNLYLDYNLLNQKSEVPVDKQILRHIISVLQQHPSEGEKKSILHEFLRMLIAIESDYERIAAIKPPADLPVTPPAPWNQDVEAIRDTGEFWEIISSTHDPGVHKQILNIRERIKNKNERFIENFIRWIEFRAFEVQTPESIKIARSKNLQVGTELEAFRYYLVLESATNDSLRAESFVFRKDWMEANELIALLNNFG